MTTTEKINVHKSACKMHARVNVFLHKKEKQFFTINLPKKHTQRVHS